MKSTNRHRIALRWEYARLESENHFMIIKLNSKECTDQQSQA